MQIRYPFALVVLLQGACAHSTTSVPATKTAEPDRGSHVAVSDSISERGLYDIIMQLARDPAAQAKLAPAARVVYGGEETTNEPLTDAHNELSWVNEAHPTLVSGTPPEQASDDATMRCVVAELRCSIEQPGGETVFRFAYTGEGAQKRVVLSQIESEEP